MLAGMQAASSLNALHQRIADYLLVLKSCRDGPVYLVEAAAVSAEELHLVRTGLSAFPVRSDWWRARYLPLLVTAADYGYSYLGPNTGFWEPLGEQLGRPISIEDRCALSGLFELAAREHGAAKPNMSPWAEHFCHIAWPIANAILPLDLQVPLADSISRLETTLARDTPPAATHEALESVAPSGVGARYLHWLKDDRLVHEVALALLGGGAESWLDPSFLTRMRADVQGNAAAHMKLEIGRVRQQDLAHSPRDRTATAHRPAESVLAGQLQLFVTRSGEPTLHVEFPPLSERGLEAARLAPTRVRLWGLGSPTRVERVFSSVPAPLRLAEFPLPSTPLILNEDLEGVSSQLADELRTYSLQIELPLIFTEADQGSRYLEWSGGSSLSGTVLVLSGLTPPEAVERVELGVIAGAPCIRVDADNTAVLAWLEELGAADQRTRWCEWVGGPHATTRAGVRIHAADPAVLGALAEGQLLAGEESAALAAGHLISLPIGSSDLSLREEHDHASRGIRVMRGAPSRVVVAQVDLHGRMTIDGLLAGDLAVNLRGDPRLQDLSLDLELEAGGARLVVRRFPVDSLPATITLTPARLAMDELDRERTSTAEIVLVRACLQGLAGIEVELAHDTAGFTWEDVPGGPVALTEAEALPLQVAAGERPLKFTAPEEAPQGSAVTLYLPRGSTHTALMGRCFSTVAEDLAWRGPERPCLVRRARTHDDEAGLIEVISGYLCWSNASAPRPDVDARRAQVAAGLGAWAVELSCGSEWIERETAALEGAVSDAWAGLLAVCKDASGDGRWVGFDEYVDSQLTQPERDLFERVLEARLRAEVPDLADLMAAPPLSEVASDALCSSFNEAYRDLADRCEGSAPRDLSPDVFNSSAEWTNAVLLAKGRLEFAPLGEMLWPRGGVESLTDFEYRGATLEAVAEVVSRWTVAFRPALQGTSWARDEVLTALLLWRSPRQAAARSWIEVCRRLLRDRGVSRAVRYAALRQARGATGTEEARCA